MSATAIRAGTAGTADTAGTDLDELADLLEAARGRVLTLTGAGISTHIPALPHTKPR